MKIELNEITIREICDGYKNSNIEGVVGYGGKLNIRPAYQREFIYDEKPRNEVIKTIQKNFPLNVMYWVKSDNGTYELMDGQQRTLSFCMYVNGDFSINEMAFYNLTKSEQEQILDYTCSIYICEGTDKERLDWFKIINIAGKELTDQELRNAIYTGEWLTDAKKHFSKPGCAAYGMANTYISGQVIRQDYLETALKWIADRDATTIEGYMSFHQKDKNCNDLWLYFVSVITWVDTIFPEYRKEIMKGQPWGIYYNKYKNKDYDAKEIKERISKLIMDDDVTNKKGIIPYLLSGEEKYLSIRAFSPAMRLEAYEKQQGVCPFCVKEHKEKTHFRIDEMDADHIVPWCQGGKTSSENCRMLCKYHNQSKGGK